METIITIAVVAAAGLWLVFWLRGKAKGGGCSCGGCGDGCSKRKIDA